ncbi:hypothetical protein [Maricaulis sp.]|uniref:hypothetical protein n=1 Tax=Maricaulis sp. TaxID=1486257 RepID=UPI0025E150D3|nr:hypothetical protein [Maricaulis sp.]MDF1768521.1 hypothetical protein [Maricaulis sp.]
MSAKYASLHAGLLARKGEASPALPSPLGQVSYTDLPQRRDIEPTRPENLASETRETRQSLIARKTASPAGKPAPVAHPASDSGSGPSLGRRPETSVSASPQGGCCSEGVTPSPPPLPGPDGPLAHRATVRLTAEQKRRLGTVSVQMNWSQQRILAIALDEWLDRLCANEMSNCACLQARKPG